MNFKTTAFLLALAIMIGAYFFFVERHAATTLEMEKVRLQNDDQEGEPLFTTDQLSAPAIDHLMIDAGDTHVEAARQGLDWLQVNPVRFALDQWSVQPIIDATAGLRFTRKFLPAQNGMPKLEELGLQPPEATVTISTSGARKVSFSIKVGKTGNGDRGYVMLDDKPEVYVVSNALHKAVLEQKLEELRRHTLPSPHESLVTRITFARQSPLAANTTLPAEGGAAQSFEMARDGTNWVLGGNNVGRVDPDKISDLLNSIASIHIDKFIADAPSDLTQFGLDKPRLTLTLVSNPTPPSAVTSDSPTPASQPATRPADAKPIIQVLRVGGPVDMDGSAFFATWADQDQPGNVVFTILKADREKLEKSVQDFRDARLTALPVGKIRVLTLQHAHDKCTLERDDAGAWTFQAPSPGFTPDSSAVSEMLEALTLIRAQGFLPNTKSLGAPIASIRLASPDQAQPDVLSIYPSPPGNDSSTWSDPLDVVMRNDEPTGLLIPAARLATVLAPFSTLRDRLIVDVGPDQIREIKIVRTALPPEDATVTLRPSPAPALTRPASPPNSTPVQWQIVSPAPDGPKIDSNSIQALLAAIAPLRATAWTADAKPTPTDARSVINLDITTDSGKTLTPSIYPDTLLGSIPGIHDYFRVDRSLTIALQGEFRDRAVVGMDVDDLKQVSIVDPPRSSAKSKPQVVTRDDLGEFHCPDIKNLSQANAGALFDALANLQAERYITPPPLSPAEPLRTLDLLTKSGQAIRVIMPSPDAHADHKLYVTAGLTLPDGKIRWFLVADDVAAKLRADLIAPPKAQESIR